MYYNINTIVRCEAGESEKFDIQMGVHQGSVLSPLLFNLVMNCLTRDDLNGDLEAMLFADDIVIVTESATEIQSKLNSLGDVLESNGHRISRSKTEYLYFPFEDEEAPAPDIYLGDVKLPNCTNFNYIWAQPSPEMQRVKMMSIIGFKSAG